MCWDLARRRIPNLVTAAVALSGLIVQLVDRGPLALASGVGAAILVMAALYRPWLAGGIGGGDVKLASAVSIWVGMGGLFWYVLYVAVAGGLVAAVVYALSARAVRREVRANLTLAALDQSLPPVSPQAPGRLSVPYAMAIAAGAVVTLWRA